MHFLSALIFAAAAAAAPAPAPSYTQPGSTTPQHNSTASPASQDLPSAVKASPRSGDMELIKSLLLAPTAKIRQNLLNQPGDLIFDFTNAPKAAIAEGHGGRVVSATAETFPALIGNGGALSVAFLGPCGLNSPHVHPRATELNVAVKGRLVTTFITENGVSATQDILNTYSMAVFPQGAIHGEYNPDCEDAVFVAGFTNVDPGVEQVAQSFFSLRGDVVSASLGGIIQGDDIESVKEILPANVVAGVESCLAKCGIPKRAKRSLEEVIVKA